MVEFFHEGGPMMFLGVLVFLGVLAVVALQFALAGRKNLVPFIVGGIALQLLVGGLATILGFSATFGALAMVDPSMRASLMAAGIAESLNNMGLALGLAIAGTILGMIAAFRRANTKTGRA
jgi:drug/metabolite transporter (DMT)-like permease